MVRALVTGGTGFIGAHVARALLAGGHTPRVLRRASSRLDALDGLTGYEAVVGDVLEPESLAAAMDGCEWVFHVAAVSDYWRQDVNRLYRVNVEGTRHVLQAARRAGVKRFIFTSSAAAVGLREDGFPADETAIFNLKPSQFPYAHSKFLAEIEVLKAVIDGLDCVVLNPTVVIGPGDLYQGSGSIVIEMARRRIPAIPAGGITLIDVRDVATAHVAAAERGRVAERYLLGAQDLGYRAWFRLVADVVGVPPPRLCAPAWMTNVLGVVVDAARAAGVPVPADGTQIRFSGRHLFFDCRKAWAELGEPQVEIRHSLLDTYAWYKARGDL